MYKIKPESGTLINLHLSRGHRSLEPHMQSTPSSDTNPLSISTLRLFTPQHNISHYPRAMLQPALFTTASNTFVKNRKKTKKPITSFQHARYDTIVQNMYSLKQQKLQMALL